MADRDELLQALVSEVGRAKGAPELSRRLLAEAIRLSEGMTRSVQITVLGLTDDMMLEAARGINDLMVGGPSEIGTLIAQLVTDPLHSIDAWVSGYGPGSQALYIQTRLGEEAVRHIVIPTNLPVHIIPLGAIP